MKKLFICVPLLLSFSVMTFADSSILQNEEKVTNGAYYYTSHPEALHHPLRVWENLEKIELNDGSIWSVSPYLRTRLTNWLLSDTIMVLPNHDSSSLYNYISGTQNPIYNYFLVNQNTGDYLLANLEELEVDNLNPSFCGHRHSIVLIDYFSNYNLIYLEDGSVWEVTPSDNAILQSWIVGDIVIIGINNDLQSFIMPNILINFSTLKYVRANCLN